MIRHKVDEGIRTVTFRACLVFSLLAHSAIFCAAANYTDHMMEMSGREPPDKAITPEMSHAGMDAIPLTIVHHPSGAVPAST